MIPESAVLIVAPLGQDASAIGTLLHAENIKTCMCRTLTECGERIGPLTGALVLTEEALERDEIPRLLERLRGQPRWSELPIIVLAGRGEVRQAALLELIAAAPGTITILERPMHAATLLHAIQVALRSRKRQYQLRDLLEEQERHVRERVQRAGELEQALARRTEEVTLAERRLATSERMAAVGTLASGLAHDMNNVLIPLGARLDTLLTHMSVDGATHDHLVAVQGLLNHLREMAKNLSLFSRDPEQEGLVGYTDLTKWSAQAWRFIESSIRAPQTGVISIRLDCEVPKGLPPVAIAPHRLTQVVLNLMHNARDAILMKRDQRAGSSADSGGRIELTARSGQPPENGPARASNGVVIIQVIDDGIGMDAETTRRCIEPFFTTKTRPGYPGGSGSGQGLALVHGIIERVGGLFSIESELGRGTTVTLTLPTAQRE